MKDRESESEDQIKDKSPTTARISQGFEVMQSMSKARRHASDTRPPPTLPPLSLLLACAGLEGFRDTAAADLSTLKGVQSGVRGI